MYYVIHKENTDDVPGSSIVYANIRADNVVLKETVAIFWPQTLSHLSCQGPHMRTIVRSEMGDSEGLKKKAWAEE